MNQIELKALAKINLGLDVLGRRENGYHDVRMVMQTIYCVEDDESIADSLKEMLENKAYIVDRTYDESWISPNRRYQYCL